MRKIIIFLMVLIISLQIVISEQDSDRDGIPDSQDQFPYDYDNDGIPDSWEKKNGLRFDVNDAKFDYDNDGLNNLAEYNLKTDPFSADSDGDGISDKDELEANTDPLDPESPSKFNFIKFLLVMGILVVILVIVYLIVKIKKREPLAKIRKQVTRPMTIPPTSRIMIPKRRIIHSTKGTSAIRKKIREREDLFKVFEKKKPLPEKPMVKKPLHKDLSIKLEDFKRRGFKKEHAAELSKLVKKSKFKEPLKRDIFTKLSKLTSAELSQRERKDTFKELSKVIKK